MVFKMARRSAGGGNPTKRVLSRRPGRRIAGSMISGEEGREESKINKIGPLKKYS